MSIVFPQTKQSSKFRTHLCFPAAIRVLPKSILNGCRIQAISFETAKQLLTYVDDGEILNIPRVEYKGLDKTNVSVGLVDFAQAHEKAQDDGVEAEIFNIEYDEDEPKGAYTTRTKVATYLDSIMESDSNCTKANVLHCIQMAGRSGLLLCELKLQPANIPGDGVNNYGHVN